MEGRTCQDERLPMAHVFKPIRASLKREYAVYVVIIRSAEGIAFYVGKTGDNREGCNPLISRCGNHFSYNKIHSQVRNYVDDHENCEYTYVFEHFGEYDLSQHSARIDHINEMERWLNQEIQELVQGDERYSILNPYLGTGFVRKEERVKRAALRDGMSKHKISDIIQTVTREVGT